MPKNGDRVRVVLEGEVTYESSRDAFWVGGENLINPKHDHVVSVEVLEPPVVTFKPGDVVKGRKFAIQYTVGQDGYYSHETNRWFPRSKHWLESEFTSERYEKVL